MPREAILHRVERYYTAKVAEHGPNARGVDWNSEHSQELRFDRLLEVVDGRDPFSLNDYGCGYGALADTLRRRFSRFEYNGFDLSAEMLARAAEHLDGAPGCRLVDSDDALRPADYTVASGIFNVKFDTPDEAWRAYVTETIARLAALSRRGFAFNMLTSYSDSEHMRQDLYYGDPCFLFDLCKRYYSRNVALLHDYGLYEFTILARLEDGA